MRKNDYCLNAKTFYAEVLDRMNDDLEVPMQYYRRTGHGPWASIRVLLPIVESIQTNKKSKYTILAEVGFKYPNIVWNMYRHGLLHNDFAPQSIQYKNKSIGWGFNYDQDKVEMIYGEIISINPWLLYNNLKMFIGSELLSLADEAVKTCTLLIFEDKQTKDKKVITEIMEL